MTELIESQLKERRDRKPDPETINRNVAICDLRKQDPVTWSQGRLAKHYDVTPRYIRKVLEEEDRWRLLASQLGTN